MSLEKYVATLVGCAIGDALFMPVEGWTSKQIKKYVGKVTGFLDPNEVYNHAKTIADTEQFSKLKCYSLGLQKGEYTDDTILTLALAESLVAVNGFSLFDIAKKQLAEYQKRLKPDGTVVGGFGKTTTDAFTNLQNGIWPLDSGVIGGPGNAPAMKMSPLGLYMDARDDYKEGLRFADSIGRITHLDPRSVASGVVQAHAIYSLLNDISKDDFIGSVVDVCQRFEKPVTKDFIFHEKGSLLAPLQWVKDNKNANPSEAHKILKSNSLVFCSYPFVLFMFQHFWNEPMDGLITTGNYGGDCDTTAAIYGALAGAKYGMIYPWDLVNEVYNLNHIINVGREMWQMKK